ncbi:hypothetical protein ZYGR_0N04880 [Zygosaccharomyces rouxii]|uniref:Sensitive to high expression protein 9, mitochondrial n=2 Tax=Zygosaccharomyces rouxii TaxID=4956 RepID=C5DW31_ZYGRC|nr:uncharacterized protein ZYRO0D11506g [Zygosaccharomyces rouxii]KAH9200910.1 Mdm33 family-domain-containing protein [Zygosaccharomyces rouxii]GAV49083.1 hypothetical protein ZYGR_0N04880 [Zygosaccharomyces rouxii]CAR28000.1 ZYRO0D11506p [Zygosaccharomyces rouxii]
MLIARRFAYLVRPQSLPVTKFGPLSIPARRFSIYKCIGQEYKESTLNKNPKSSQKNSKPWLEPRWNNIKAKLDDTRKVVNKYATQLQYHFSKARDAIRDANKKIAEQERDRSNQRLNYNKDVENDGQIQGLPSEREIYRRKWSRKLEFYLDSLQETIFTATRALNDVTGYSSIQKLRKSIQLMEGTLEETRSELRELKEDYAMAIEERTRSQRELNELLQRKNIWTPEELERFTLLYKNDAMNLKKEQQLKTKVNAMEVKQEKLNDDLYRAILTRYHEEQIWSDKIRRTSTWGTFLLMTVNIILFLVFQLLLEPWKRRRLTSSFEVKVKQALDQYADEQTTALKDLSATMHDKKSANEPVATDDGAKTAITPTTKEISQKTMDYVYEKPWQFYEAARAYTIHMWNWIKIKAARFDPSDALNLHSEKTLTNLQLYACSIFLFICGTAMSRII